MSKKKNKKSRQVQWTLQRGNSNKDTGKKVNKESKKRCNFAPFLKADKDNAGPRQEGNQLSWFRKIAIPSDYANQKLYDL